MTAESVRHPDGQVIKHLPGEHDQKDHGSPAGPEAALGTRMSTVLDTLISGISPSDLDDSQKLKRAGMQDAGRAIRDAGLTEAELEEASAALSEASTLDTSVITSDAAEAIAATLQDTWARSSSDHQPLSIFFQIVVAEMFDLPPLTVAENLNENIRQTVLALQGSEHLNVVARAYAAHVYGETQDFLREAGITSLPLARGFVFSFNDVRHRPPSWYEADPGPVKVKLNPLSSFSSSLHTALTFADPTGSVIAAEVPAERVFATFRSGLGCAYESEVIILGGLLDCYAAESRTVKIRDERYPGEESADTFQRLTGMFGQEDAGDTISKHMPGMHDQRSHLTGLTRLRQREGYTAARLTKLARRVGSGELDRRAFVEEARQLLENTYFAAAKFGLGRAPGGGLVSRFAVKAAAGQVPFLRELARDAASLSDAELARRAALYASSSWQGYNYGRVLRAGMVRWQTQPNPCALCAARDGKIYVADELPALPGSGGFGEICEGGANCRCRLVVVKAKVG